MFDAWFFVHLRLEIYFEEFWLVNNDDVQISTADALNVERLAKKVL